MRMHEGLYTGGVMPLSLAREALARSSPKTCNDGQSAKAQVLRYSRASCRVRAYITHRRVHCLRGVSRFAIPLKLFCRYDSALRFKEPVCNKNSPRTLCTRFPEMNHCLCLKVVYDVIYHLGIPNREDAERTGTQPDWRLH